VICTQHLLQLGHRLIGYIGGPDTQASGKLRVEGMAATLQNADLALDPQLIRQGPLHIDFGRNSMVQLLNIASPATAIVLGNSLQALGALEGLQAKGVHVPEDISLILHGDPDWARVWGCGLTAIGRPVTELASDVTSLLLQTIADWDALRIAPGEALSLLLEPYLVMRGSTAPLDNMSNRL
jgi:DNA-binding LacI/PurR family transcriptional regulator